MVLRDNRVLSVKCIKGDHEEMDFKDRHYTHVTSFSP